jgi:hypothetical protein
MVYYRGESSPEKVGEILYREYYAASKSFPLKYVSRKQNYWLNRLLAITSIGAINAFFKCLHDPDCVSCIVSNREDCVSSKPQKEAFLRASSEGKVRLIKELYGYEGWADLLAAISDDPDLLATLLIELPDHNARMKLGNQLPRPIRLEILDNITQLQKNGYALDSIEPLNWYSAPRYSVATLGWNSICGLCNKDYDNFDSIVDKSCGVHTVHVSCGVKNWPNPPVNWVDNPCELCHITGVDKLEVDSWKNKPSNQRLTIYQNACEESRRRYVRCLQPNPKELVSLFISLHWLECTRRGRHNGKVCDMGPLQIQVFKLLSERGKVILLNYTEMYNQKEVRNLVQLAREESVVLAARLVMGIQHVGLRKKLALHLPPPVHRDLDAEIATLQDRGGKDRWLLVATETFAGSRCWVCWKPYSRFESIITTKACKFHTAHWECASKKGKYPKNWLAGPCQLCKDDRSHGVVRPVEFPGNDQRMKKPAETSRVWNRRGSSARSVNSVGSAASCGASASKTGAVGKGQTALATDGFLPGEGASVAQKPEEDGMGDLTARMADLEISPGKGKRVFHKDASGVDT